jgi:hypothetical protein
MNTAYIQVIQHYRRAQICLKDIVMDELVVPP